MSVRAFVISEPGRFHFEERESPQLPEGHALLRVRSVGLCGTDLSSFRGSNPLVSYPRVPGHEIAATVVELNGPAPEGITPGANVAVSPYKNCGKCSSCLRGRPNACQFNETLGVQRDGAMTYGETERQYSFAAPICIFQFSIFNFQCFARTPGEMAAIEN